MGITSKTFCPKLWTEIFINELGDVYPCCRRKTPSIGNIYNDTLEEICNSKRALNLREKSFTGKLECFERCHLLKGNSNLPLVLDTKISYNRLTKLKVQFSYSCNIKCIMCFQNPENNHSLDYDTLIKNVDIKPFKEIDIQGGEPLLINNAKKYYDYAVSFNIKPSFITNGLLIDNIWADKIAKNSKYIHISINAATKKTHELVNLGSNWKKVIENIKKLHNAKKTNNSKLKIIGHMTIIPENLFEIPLFINKGKKIGFEYIKFGYDKKIPKFLKSLPENKKIKLIKKIKKAYLNKKDKIIINMLRLKLLYLYTE